MTCKIPTLFRKFAAEFLGTMILVVFGCGAALLFSSTFPLTTLTVALAFGLVIIAMAAAIGAGMPVDQPCGHFRLSYQSCSFACNAA